jgi:hypothetical protein
MARQVLIVSKITKIWNGQRKKRRGKKKKGELLDQWGRLTHGRLLE